MIIVTGANGFIGSVMVWELNQKGLFNIIATDEVGLDVRNILKHRKFDRFMLKDQLWDFLETEEAKSQVTWVIHMGACSSTTETNKEYLWDTNLNYTKKLFTWCQQHGKSFVYASSAATYGAGEKGFDDRTDSETLRPLNLYGESKVEFDRWAVKQSLTPPHWFGLKFFNVFGPNEYHKGSMTSVAFKAFHQIKEKGSLGLFKSYNSQYKDGEQMRDFIYVKDVTRWIWELMEKKPESGIYNMGFGKARTWLDLARAIFVAMKKEEKISWLEMPESLREQYQYFTEAKMQKWQAAGLSPSAWPIEKAVLDYVENHLNHSDPLL